MTTRTSGTHWSLAGTIEAFKKTFNFRSVGNEAGSIALADKKLLEIEDGPTSARYAADSGVAVFINDEPAPLRGTFVEGQRFRAMVSGGAEIHGEYKLPKEARK